MNTKALLGFLAGLLAATGVFYVQSHRSVKIEPPPAAPVAVAPEPKRTPIPEPAPPKTPPKRIAAAKPIPAPAPVPAPIEEAKAAPAPPPEPPPAPVVTPVVPPAVTSEPRPEPLPEPAKVEPRSVTIASGTLLTVRLGETISTERSRPGDSFAATLDQPLVIDGLVIAEKGARVTGRVDDAVEAGRVKGLAHLSLELASLTTSDGQRIDLRTERFHKDGESSKTQDTQKVGIGAAIGAAIGAIAGGGKGAAIGAASGGAAGGGVVAATRGKPAVLLAETKIAFRVERPVTITEKR